MNKYLIDYKGIHEGETVLSCGMGESLFRHLDRLAEFVTIGVNDICRYFTPNYLIVIDRLAKFPPDRLANILYARNACKAIFTPHEKDLAQLHGGTAHVVHIKVRAKEPWVSTVPNLDSDHLFVAITSTYTGAVLAAYMGAKRIGFLGVDFTNHELGSQENMYEVNLDYKGLATACHNTGVLLLNLSETSLLATVNKGTFKDLEEGLPP